MTGESITEVAAEIMASHGVLPDDTTVRFAHTRAMIEFAEAKAAHYYRSTCACRAAEQYVPTCPQHGHLISQGADHDR